MKGKTQKGITLIALIITIVVLLILAVVAISAIQNENIIAHANNSATKYNEAVANEQDILQGYLNHVNGNGGSTDVEEPGDEDDVTPVELKVGSYVEYDVNYTDMYSGIVYDNSEEGKYGWRYLGTDGENKLLISTAIPMILYYYSSADDNSAQWWDTNQLQWESIRMTEGLKENLAKIPYEKVSAGTKSTNKKNTMIGLFGDENTKVVGDYFKSSTLASKIKNVRTLTLAELNRAVNSANGNNDREDTTTVAGFKDLEDEALGLFDMRKLPNYGEDTTYSYWSGTYVPGHNAWVYYIAHDYDVAAQR